MPRMIRSIADDAFEFPGPRVRNYFPVAGSSFCGGVSAGVPDYETSGLPVHGSGNTFYAGDGRDLFSVKHHVVDGTLTFDAAAVGLRNLGHHEFRAVVEFTNRFLI